ncbi:AAA family ATPase [Prevotella nigrescens]
MKNLNLQPNKSSWASKRLDEKSVRLLRKILEDKRVDTSNIEEGGTEANTDGYISILDVDDTIVAKVTVQIKHYNNNTISKKGVCYDIPTSLLAYAHRMKGEVVLFITCDTNNDIVYWKYIARAFVESQIANSENIQQTYRYYFKDNENLTENNVDSVIDLWETLYHEQMLSLKDEKSKLLDFLDVNLKSFEGITTTFYGLKGSHIARKETDQLFDWIQGDLTSKDCQLKLLVGNAGVGKTVIIKDLLDKLTASGIKCLTIKADYYNITENETSDFSLERLHASLDLLVSEHKRVVFIIDQIDALSQYLSNDRDKLNILLNVIAAWEKEYSKDIRIIVSCRKYDLEYDPSLSQLKEHSTAIEVNRLDDKDVEYVINKLDSGLYCKLTSQTITILKTAQYLDVFCRLYGSGNVREYNCQNYMELYDGLWLSLINYANEHTPCSNLEDVMFEIAKSVQEAETLTPTWLITASNNKATRYLASESIVKYNNKRISFFHQTFYDYVLARYYVSNKKSFITELKKRFQGLEIRSSIKIFLDFEREHSDSLYKKNINTIIFSDDIRLHLKQLALSILSYSDAIYKFEIDIIKKLPKLNHQLFIYFLSTTSNPLWFPTIKDLIQPFVADLTTENDYFNPLRILFSNYASKFPDDIYNMVDTIKDISTKEEITMWILRNHNDYSNEKVRESYIYLKVKLNVDLVSCVMDAIDTNLNFALEETKELLINYFLNNNKHKSHYDYELFEQICERFYKEYPKDFLVIAYDCFVQIVSKTRKQSYQWYSINEIFSNYMSDYAEKFFEWLGNLLIQYIGEQDFGTSMVEKLLSLEDESAFILSFKVIAAKPTLFDTYIKNLVSNNEELDKFIEFGDVRYYFLEALSKWYLSVSHEEQVKYQVYILKYRSKGDYIHNNDRSYNKLVLPYLGWHKWQLLCCTILESTLSKDAKRCKQELCRRFNDIYQNEKPDYHVTAASICGGITTQEIYNHFSPENWLSSFGKLDERRAFRKGNFSPISLRAHAEAFTKCVENSPEKYKRFIFSLHDNPNIKSMYQEAGLLGLLLGGADKTELAPLFQKYMNVSSIRDNVYTFEQLAMNYTKEENCMIDDLIPILVQTIKQPLLLKNVQEDLQVKSLADVVQHKLNIAINSFQGRALKILISICALSTRRTQIYNLLNLLYKDLATELCLEVLYYIYYKEYYDEVLTDKLFSVYLSGSGADGLIVRTDVVQSYFYFKTDTVRSYIADLMQDNRCHDILAQIFFYGLYHDDIRDICKQNLNKILLLNDKKVIATMIRLSLENISESCYREIASDILLCHIADNRVEIVKSYEYHIDDLSVEDFNLFKEITKNWNNKTHRERFSQIKYLEKCANMLPLDCYMYIKAHDFLHANDFYLREKIVKLLLGIYKQMKEEENLNVMNKMMNLFDEYVIANSYIINDAIEKLGV